jgi:hypothetical protein
MRNFTLPRGSCNFLDLRISPWEIPFLLLLSISLLPGALSFSPNRWHLSLWLPTGGISLSGPNRRRGSGGAGAVARRRRSWRAGARRHGAGAALARERHAGSGDGVRGAAQATA